MAEVIAAHRESFFGGKLPAYDGRKSIYTAGSLPFESKEFVIKLSDKDKDKGKDKEKKGKKRYIFFKLKDIKETVLCYVWEPKDVPLNIRFS